MNRRYFWSYHSHLSCKITFQNWKITASTGSNCHTYCQHALMSFHFISLPFLFSAQKTSKNPQKKISFVFATGGAGICLSQALTLKLIPIAGYGRFESIADRIGLPDDVTMGYIIEHLLKVPLTVIDTFHSHLEPMEFLRADTFKEQITFSYANIQNDTNTIQIDGFNRVIDPTRFYTLHCHLFPHVRIENGPNCLQSGVT